MPSLPALVSQRTLFVGSFAPGKEDCFYAEAVPLRAQLRDIRFRLEMWAEEEVLMHQSMMYVLSAWWLPQYSDTGVPDSSIGLTQVYGRVNGTDRSDKSVKWLFDEQVPKLIDPADLGTDRDIWSLQTGDTLTDASLTKATADVDPFGPLSDYEMQQLYDDLAGRDTSLYWRPDGLSWQVLTQPAAPMRLFQKIGWLGWHDGSAVLGSKPTQIRYTTAIDGNLAAGLTPGRFPGYVAFFLTIPASPPDDACTEADLFPAAGDYAELDFLAPIMDPILGVRVGGAGMAMQEYARWAIKWHTAQNTPDKVSKQGTVADSDGGVSSSGRDSLKLFQPVNLSLKMFARPFWTRHIPTQSVVSPNSPA